MGKWEVCSPHGHVGYQTYYVLCLLPGRRGHKTKNNQAVLERTWKVVQEHIAHGSDMNGLKNKVWTMGIANHQCSTCGIYVSDKSENGGTQRCHGARNTTAEFNGHCYSCRFHVRTIDWMDSCVTARHSCHTCKRRHHEWAAIISRGEHVLETTNVMPSNFVQMGMEEAVRASIQWMMQQEIESLRNLDVHSAMVINTDASMQGAGISWRDRCQAIRTPIRGTRQIHREDVEDFMDQGRHNGWSQSTEVMQRSTMTKRRARRLNRYRPSIALDEHRHDHGDNNDGAQATVVQNNNEYRQCVSFSRKSGRFTESQPINFTQMRIDAHSKQTTNHDRQGATEARKLKITWKRRVTGVHPSSAFMRIDYRMFEYDAEKSKYR